MTRQVALGAVVAFGLTVLVLSVCQPTADQPAPQPAPAPSVAVQDAPPPTPGDKRALQMMPAKPLMLRPSNALRPEMLQPQKVEPAALDAGAP